jgi:hypothetical protein
MFHPVVFARQIIHFALPGSVQLALKYLFTANDNGKHPPAA